MFVLSRKTNERIIVGTNIVLTVVSVSGDRVKLGVEAPRNIRVDSDEVYKRRQEELRLSGSCDGATFIA